MSERRDKIQRDVRLQTREVTPELIAYIVGKMARIAPLQRIIVFGSHARGGSMRASDLDLFVVQDSGKSNRQVRREIERLLWGRRFGVDLIVRRPEEVTRNVSDGNPFYTRQILEEGQLLYERQS